MLSAIGPLSSLQRWTQERQGKFCACVFMVIIEWSCSMGLSFLIFSLTHCPLSVWRFILSGRDIILYYCIFHKYCSRYIHLYIILQHALFSAYWDFVFLNINKGKSWGTSMLYRPDSYYEQSFSGNKVKSKWSKTSKDEIISIWPFIIILRLNVYQHQR